MVATIIVLVSKKVDGTYFLSSRCISYIGKRPVATGFHRSS